MPLLPNARRELAIAGVTGALSLVSPADLGPRALLVFRVTCATLSGAFTYDTLRNDEELADQPAARVSLAVGAAGAVFGTMGLWERWDASLHRWLLRRGVSRPRWVIAAGTAATSLVAAAMEARATETQDEHEELGPVIAPLDPRLREVLVAVLASTEELGSPLLQQQLTRARAAVWGPDGSEGEELPGFLELVVVAPGETADVARVVPHSFTFPVRAEFDHDGTTYALRLGVEEGWLSSVTLVPVPEAPAVSDAAGGTESWPKSWPAVADISLRHDGEEATPTEGRR
jgi:hypothetical protein